MMMKRLLIVDDEESIRFAFERYFTRVGFVVDGARELEEAEALAAHTAYDVAFIDLSLTENGCEGLELLRFFSHRCPDTRTIILTARQSPLIEREAYRRGADLLLHKPRPLAELAQLVSEFIGKVA